MARFEKVIRGGSFTANPLTLLYGIVKDRSLRNQNTKELNRLSRFMKEDIGFYN